VQKIPHRMDFSSEYFFQNKASLFPGVLNNLYLFDLGNQCFRCSCLQGQDVGL